MDQRTHEVRLQHWKNIISQCRLHPRGQTAKQCAIQKVPPVLVPADRGAASAVIRTATFTIELADNISGRLLSSILRGVSHA